MKIKIRNNVIDLGKYYPLLFTVIFVSILFQYSFYTMEAIFYDLRVQLDIGSGPSKKIVIITMDEESDEYLGESYPFTFSSHSKMLERLFSDKPLIVNYLIDLSERVSEVDLEENATGLKKIIRAYVDKGGYFRFGTKMDPWGEHRPPKELEGIGHSLALINIDNSQFAKDDVSRRMILNISGENSLHMWTANKYREINGLRPLVANKVYGSYYVPKADATFVQFRYSQSTKESAGKITTIPFHKVRVGNFPKDFFKGKIVLVGPKYVSNYTSNSSDYVLTPFNREEYESPKMFLHGQLIEALIQHKTVYPLPKEVSFALSIILAIVLSIVISRIRPTHGLAITLTCMGGIVLISYLLFVIFGIWVYVTHIMLTIFVVYYIWVPFRAIGEYQRRYAIQEEAKLLKKVEHLKQNFISLMSHDLKTPVAKMAGLADITMKIPGIPDEARSNMNSIIESTKELNKFITSILDLTKVESRNLTLNKISKDVNLIIEDIVEELSYKAKSQNIKIDVDLAPLYPVHIDVVLIKRVLSNLVENALKYSGEGTSIYVKSWDDADWVYIDVKDTGVGISEEDLEHIFEKFYRVKNDASHVIKGSGLGLYLVKYFVELHGGKISVESNMGQGTKFTVKLINR